MASSPDGGAAVRPVEVPYDLLVASNDETSARRVDALIEEAFGPDGLGLVTISGVPGFVQARQKLLPLAAKLAQLHPAALASLEHAPSLFSVGWSHGKEALSAGKTDVHKGSFYANPTTDDPAEEDPTVTEEDVARYPGYYHPNVWPSRGGESDGDGSNGSGNTTTTNPNNNSSLPELEPAFKALGRIVVETGLLLAERCDAYVRRAWERRYGSSSSSSSQQPPSSLADALRASRCHKARLLHYFPPGAGAGVVAATAAAAAAAAANGGAAAAAATTPTTTTTPVAAENDADDADGWCGWHRDHGALTGLTCAMYTRPSTTRAPRLSCADDAHGVAAFGGGKAEEDEPPLTNPSPRPASPPDARAGLYVRTRSGRAARADIPADHLAFQVGQVAAIVSGGLLCATPHCVRAPCAGASSGSDVSRETFAVFLQPDVRAPLSVPCPPPVEAAKEAADADAEVGQEAASSLAALLLLSTADSGQYRPGDSFGDFAERTVRENYGSGGGGGEGEGKAAAGGGGGGGGLQLGARAGAADDDDAANEPDSPSARLPAAVYVVHE